MENKKIVKWTAVPYETNFFDIGTGAQAAEGIFCSSKECVFVDIIDIRDDKRYYGKYFRFHSKLGLEGSYRSEFCKEEDATEEETKYYHEQVRKFKIYKKLKTL